MKNREITKWKRRNPLRKFRTYNDLTQHDIAHMIGVNHFTVQRWERGVTYPNEKNMLKLENLISDIEEKWGVWMDEKPKF